MKALILCGGQGTRLRPITNDTPKPLLKIKNQALLEHIIDLYKKYRINEILLSVGYHKEKIMDYFGNGSDFGVKIKYVEENQPLGTAGPLRLAKGELKETFFVSNGDDLNNTNLREMLEFHKSNKALVTIALTRVDDPSLYGAAVMNGDNIKEFIEKPKKKEAHSHLVNTGLYVIEPSVIDMIPAGNSSLERNIFPKIAAIGKLFGFRSEGQFFDVGTMEQYRNAEKNWKGLD